MRYRNRLIFGFGVNDADYVVTENGAVTCPYYNKWRHMIERCYSIKYQNRNPSYKGCSVCSEWRRFSIFREWMEREDWKGKDLDKDLLIKGNREYSPKACIFVSPEINKLLNSNKSNRGQYPLGVCLDKRGSIMAQCKKNGKMVYLGVHGTAREAHEAYKKFKYKIIHEIAFDQKDPLKTALLNHVITG